MPGLPGEGNLLVFSNGIRQRRPFSSVEEWTPPLEGGRYVRQEGEDFGPDDFVWHYEDPDNFFSANISGAQRLPNGNTLVCEGASGRFFEVTPEKEIVWEFVNADLGMRILAQGEAPPTMGRGTPAVFRATRLGLDYPGLAGRDLTPGPLLEESQP